MGNESILEERHLSELMEEEKEKKRKQKKKKFKYQSKKARCVMEFGYHLFFMFRSGWTSYKQSKKLEMDSEQVSALVEEKYPQFLFSWKSFRDLSRLEVM